MWSNGRFVGGGLSGAPLGAYALCLVTMTTLIVSLGLDSCGLQPGTGLSTDGPDKLSIATDSEIRTGGMTAHIVGILRGVVNHDRTACFRVESPAPSFTNVPLFWPHGYAAREHPLRVVDPKGNTVALDGQKIDFGGGIVDLGKNEHILGCGDHEKVLRFS